MHIEQCYISNHFRPSDFADDRSFVDYNDTTDCVIRLASLIDSKGGGSIRITLKKDTGDHKDLLDNLCMTVTRTADTPENMVFVLPATYEDSPLDNIDPILEYAALGYDIKEKRIIPVIVDKAMYEKDGDSDVLNLFVSMYGPVAEYTIQHALLLGRFMHEGILKDFLEDVDGVLH